MGKTVIIPAANPIHFAEKDLIVTSQDGLHPFGSALYAHTLRGSQPRIKFYQPFNRADKIVLHLHFTQGDGDYVVLDFYDEDGTNLKWIDFDTPYIVLGGNVDLQTGAQLVTAQVKFTFSEFSELDNSDKIYLRIKVGGDGEEKFYKSELIELAESHENTSWLQFSHLINDYGVLFEQFKTVFGLRVPSSGMVYEPAGEYSVMEDQKKQLVKLHAQNCNTFKWSIGGKKGIPEYLVKIIDEAMQMDLIRIDGRDYIREEGATLERVGSEGKPLQWRSILLRQARTDDSYTFRESRIKLFTKPAYPFATPEWFLTDGLNTVTFDPYSLHDASAEASWLAYATGELTDAGLTGEIVLDGDTYYYVNGLGQNFSVSSITAIASFAYIPLLTQCLVLTLQVDDVVNAWRYSAKDQGYHIIAWGDGTVSVHNYEQDNNGYKEVTRSHTYAGLGTKTARIYSDNAMTRLSFSANQLNKITNISGKVSTKLESFLCMGQNFSGLSELDIDFLLEAQGVIKELSLYDCGIAKIKAGWAGAKADKRYTNLKTWGLNKNAMSVANVNAFASEFVQFSGWKAGNSTMDLRQTPAAPPSGTGLSDINYVKTFSWSIWHD